MLNTDSVSGLSPSWILAVGLFFAVGCSDLEGTGGTGGMTGSGGSPGTGGSDAGPPDTVALFVTALATGIPFEDDGSLQVGDPGIGAPPLEGVEVCELDTDKCLTTNAEGRALLHFPTGQEVAITQVKDGYLSFIDPYTTDASFPGEQMVYGRPNDQVAAVLNDHLGLEYPLEGGIVIVNAAVPEGGDPYPEGITFVLENSNERPFYLDGATGRYTYDLEGSTAAPLQWALPFTMGGFANLSPGEYEIVFGGAAQNCIGPRRAWPGSTTQSVRVPVRDGFVTLGSIQCVF